MELHKCLEMGTLLQTTMILLKCRFIQHIFIMTPGDFSIIIIERSTTSFVKSRSRHFSHVGLCCGASDTTTRSAAVMGRARDS